VCVLSIGRDGEEEDEPSKELGMYETNTLSFAVSVVAEKKFLGAVRNILPHVGKARLGDAGAATRLGFRELRLAQFQA